MFEALMGGMDVSARPNLYIPINEQRENIQNRAQELTKLAEFNANEALVAELGNNWQTQPYAWLPLKANNQDMVVLIDRKSTRLNSSHVRISYAVFCLKKKKKTYNKYH